MQLHIIRSASLVLLFRFKFLLSVLFRILKIIVNREYPELNAFQLSSRDKILLVP